jgi:two-component system sensor histidine kinase BarA
LLTPTLETHDTPLSGLASGHLTKPVCRDSLYDELLLLVHGISTGQRQLPTPTATREPVQQSDPAPRVLAVDDNDANLKLVLTLLHDCRIEAEGASSGFEALSKARQKPFDLVFMDLQMPGMDGVETTERLRGLDHNSHRTRIIALTAHALAEEQDRLTRQGFDGYLAKPISNSQLVDIIYDYTGYNCDAGMDSGYPSVPEVRDTRRALRPSTRKKQADCVSVAESIQLAAGKADLAEELFSMLVEQIHADLDRVNRLWNDGDREELLECVHKLHGATRYCGVPELRGAANQLETALKCASPDTEYQKDQLLVAMERLQTWSEQTDWQQLFREQNQQATAD